MTALAKEHRGFRHPGIDVTRAVTVEEERLGRFVRERNRGFEPAGVAIDEGTHDIDASEIKFGTRRLPE